MIVRLRAAVCIALGVLASAHGCAPGMEKVVDVAGGQAGAMLRQQGVLTGTTGAVTHNLMSQSGTLLSSFDVSPERQTAVAEHVHKQVLRQYRRSQDEALEDYLSELARHMAGLAGAPDAASFRVYLLDHGMLNAFTTGAGHVYVTTRLVRELRTEAQMAMVIGHEVAHAIRSHPARGMRDRAVMKAAVESAIIAGTGSGAIDPLGKVVFEYTASAAISGHGRSFEEEADEIGLELMVKAGYDPAEAPKVFQRFLEVHGDQDPLTNFLHGTHPTNRARMARLEKLIAERYAGARQDKTIGTSRGYLELVRRTYWR